MKRCDLIVMANDVDDPDAVMATADTTAVARTVPRDLKVEHRKPSSRLLIQEPEHRSASQMDPR